MPDTPALLRTGGAAGAEASAPTPLSRPWPASPARPQVPASAAAAPVPTRAQLSDRFLDVARLSRQLSMLPEGRGGMLSLAVAKLAAALKARRRGCQAGKTPGTCIRRWAAVDPATVVALLC